MAGLLDAPGIQRIIPPAVTLLILFLTIYPQYLFNLTTDPDSSPSSYLSPGPLTPFQIKYINTWSLYILYTYYKTVRTDPGHFTFTNPNPKTSDPAIPSDPTLRTPAHFSHLKMPPGTRWCRKCSAPKPPRAHHCKLCARCIPRMDHHCPWTANCVSARTHPHFIRFVLSAAIGLWVLFRLVVHRLAPLWSLRNEPAYLGPNLSTLTGLAILTIVNFISVIALTLIALQATRSWLLNETMIEGWQRDRHATLLAKGPTWFPTSDGDRVRLQHVEFPYDIDFFTNLAQGMATYIPLLWFFPLMPTPTIGPPGRGFGWEYPENGFNRLPGMWPPPDPSRRAPGGTWPAADLKNGLSEQQDSALLRESTVEEQKRAFRIRQEMDRMRWAAPEPSAGAPGRERGRILREVIDEETDMLTAYDGGEGEGGDAEVDDDRDDSDDEDYELFDGPAPKWRNADGETLEDYGVEGGDNSEEDIPLGELIRRRRGAAQGARGNSKLV